MSKFVDEMRKKGLVKPASEAFKEYPVELEDHKGDVNYFIKEKIVPYGKYEVGDIVFVKEYKYEDGSIGNNHLFVVVDDDNYCTSLEYFGLVLSSHIDKIQYDSNILLKANTTNNLHKDSIVKTDSIYVLAQKDILFKIGEVSLEDVKKYKEKVGILC